MIRFQVTTLNVMILEFVSLHVSFLSSVCDVVFGKSTNFCCFRSNAGVWHSIESVNQNSPSAAKLEIMPHWAMTKDTCGYSRVTVSTVLWYPQGWVSKHFVTFIIWRDVVSLSCSHNIADEIKCLTVLFLCPYVSARHWHSGCC